MTRIKKTIKQKGGGTLIALTIFILFPFSAHANILAGRIIELTNQQRIQAKLPPLKPNPRLMKSAMLKAEDILKNKYWAHVSPSGVKPWYWFDKAKYNYSYAGENLAKDWDKDTDVIKAWLASEEHKKNIINKNYLQIGVAVVEGIVDKKPTILVVEHFGAE